MSPYSSSGVCTSAMHRCIARQARCTSATRRIRCQDMAAVMPS
jgi:hypothetical protein